MRARETVARHFKLGLVGALFLQGIAFAQQKPFGRSFSAASEERYEVAISLRAQAQSISTETVASKTYVMPVVHEAEVRLKWRATRRIVSVLPDRSAEIEENIAWVGPCEGTPQTREHTDPNLQSSLARLCASLAHPASIRYTENAKGLLHEAGASGLTLNLGEEDPQLLALWLRRAVRPNVLFPLSKLESGARSTHEFTPSGELFKNAHGSESTEWLEAPSDPPSASLHVIQQLSWDDATQAGASKDGESRSGARAVPRHETFFADSITTVSLLDGSVVRAKRSASRTMIHKIEPVEGLPNAPDFSSKLAISVNIERLP